MLSPATRHKRVPSRATETKTITKTKGKRIITKWFQLRTIGECVPTV